MPKAVFARRDASSFILLEDKGRRERDRVKMMYYEQQQPARIETARDEREAAARRKTAAVDEERLEIVDLSGLSLDSLPSPSLDLGIICKLDLSNNNLQVNDNTSISLSLSLMPTSKKRKKKDRTGPDTDVERPAYPIFSRYMHACKFECEIFLNVYQFT